MNLLDVLMQNAAKSHHGHTIHLDALMRLASMINGDQRIRTDIMTVLENLEINSTRDHTIHRIEDHAFIAIPITTTIKTKISIRDTEVHFYKSFQRDIFSFIINPISVISLFHGVFYHFVIDTISARLFPYLPTTFILKTQLPQK